MSRITNSNILRLGTSLSWDGSYSLRHTLFVVSYVPYFLERTFFHDRDEAFYGCGPINVRYVRGSLVINIFIYNLRPYTRSKFKVRLRRLVLVFLVRSLTENLNRHFIRSVLLVCLKPIIDLDAVFVINYFKLRLFQKFSVREALTSLRKLLQKVPGLVGYRFDITGRYARQQRAGKLSVKRGVITLSSYCVNITYVEDFVILKHGKCGFKVWLNRLPGYSRSSYLLQS